MALDIFTINQTSDEIGKSRFWVWQAIKLKKFKAEKVGNVWTIPGEVIRQFKKSPFQITDKEKAKLNKE